MWNYRVISAEPIHDREWLVKGRDAMRHRGPDSEGIYWSNDGRVGLGTSATNFGPFPRWTSANASASREN